MTLTYPPLARASSILWIVTGDEKRDALARLIAGDLTIPGGRVDRDRAVVVTDLHHDHETPEPSSHES